MRLIGLSLLWSMSILAVAQEPMINKAERPLLEQRNYRDLPGNDDIQQWLRASAAKTDNARYTELGHSAGERLIGALLISDDDTFLSHASRAPESAASEIRPLPDSAVIDREPRLRMMIVGGQHGNETASPEAVQRVVHELLAGELSSLPELVDIIVIPVGNPDGRDLGRRENADGVNTNTDYILLSQPESQTLSRAISKWQPHTVIDVHESDAYKEDTLAQQGYITDFSIQYEVGFEPNIDKRLREFGVQRFLPAVIRQAEEQGLQARRYIKEIRDVNSPVTHGGITLRNFRNYAGFHHIFSVLVEGRVDPPQGHYPTPGNIRHRTNELFQSVAAYMREAFAMRHEIVRLATTARADWQGLAEQSQVALESVYTLNPDQPLINIRLKEIGSDRDVHVEFKNHSKVTVLKTIDPPSAYLITDHQERIAELLQRHGISYQRLTRPFRFNGMHRAVENLEVTPPRFGKGRYHVSLQLQEEAAEIHALAGDLWIKLTPPYHRLVPLLLEPRSSTSIFQEPDYKNLLREGKFFIVPVSNASIEPPS